MSESPNKPYGPSPLRYPFWRSGEDKLEPPARPETPAHEWPTEPPSPRNGPLAQHFPWRSYYNVNWMAKKPHNPEGAPNRNRIPERVAPLGFILAFGLNGESEFTKQAEVDYLIETQHSQRCFNRKHAWNGCCNPTDIAPEWQEMRENYFLASSLDQLRDHEADEAETAGDITYDQKTIAPYDMPSRAEQALSEWEQSSWVASPVVRAHWDVTDAGKLTLVLDSIKHQAGPYITHRFTAEAKQQIVKSLIDSAAKDGTIPTIESVLERQFEYDRHRALGIPFPRAQKPAYETEWELEDPYRYGLHNSDPQTHNRRQENNWNSPWLLGHEDPDDDFRNEFTDFVTGELDHEEVALREAPDDLEAGYKPLNAHDFHSCRRLECEPDSVESGKTVVRVEKRK